MWGWNTRILGLGAIWWEGRWDYSSILEFGNGGDLDSGEILRRKLSADEERGKVKKNVDINNQSIIRDGISHILPTATPAEKLAALRVWCVTCLFFLQYTWELGNPPQS